MVQQLETVWKLNFKKLTTVRKGFANVFKKFKFLLSLKEL